MKINKNNIITVLTSFILTDTVIDISDTPNYDEMTDEEKQINKFSMLLVLFHNFMDEGEITDNDLRFLSELCDYKFSTSVENETKRICVSTRDETLKTTVDLNSIDNISIN